MSKLADAMQAAQDDGAFCESVNTRRDCFRIGYVTAIRAVIEDLRVLHEADPSGDLTYLGLLSDYEYWIEDSSCK